MMQWSTDPRTVNEVAFDRLQDLILGGQLTMGERLDERSLAERIAVSRTPLRHAIGRLANLGVIEQKTYRGSFVRVFTCTQIAELYELRKVLEGLATRKATARITAERLDALEEIVNRGTRAFAVRDTEMFEAADREFHSLIAEESGNGLLIEHLKNLELRIQIVRHLVNLEHDVAALTVDDRLRVLDAMREGDASGAEAAMIEHIGVVEAEALRRLSEPE